MLITFQSVVTLRQAGEEENRDNRQLKSTNRESLNLSGLNVQRLVESINTKYRF